MTPGGGPPPASAPQPPEGSRRGIWTSWLIRTVLIQLCAVGLLSGVRAVVSYRALELGATPGQLGVLAGAFALLALVTAMPLGRWVDRLGPPRFAVAGTSMLLLTSLWMTTVDSVLILIVTQAALGLGQVTIAVSLQTLIANGGGAEGRVLRFGAWTLMGSLGQMVAPAITTSLYASSGSADNVFLLYAALSAVGVSLATSLWLRPPPELAARRAAASPDAGRSSLGRTAIEVLRRPSVPRVMFASIASISCLDLLVVYLPAYGHARGIAPVTIGLLLSVRGAVGVISRVGLGLLLRWLGRRGVLLFSLLFPAAALALVPTTASTPILMILMVVAGVGLGLGQPVSMAWVADLVPGHIRGTALAVRVSGNRLGQLLIPLGAGLIAGTTGVGAVFVAMGAALGTAAVSLRRVADTQEA